MQTYDAMKKLSKKENFIKYKKGKAILNFINKMEKMQ